MPALPLSADILNQMFAAIRKAVESAFGTDGNQWRRAFEHFDTDGDDALTEAEFAAMIAATKPAFSAPAFARAYMGSHGMEKMSWAHFRDNIVAMATNPEAVDRRAAMLDARARSAAAGGGGGLALLAVGAVALLALKG